MSRNQAIVVSQAAAAQIEAAGMTAQNQLRQHRGEEPEYKLEDFENLIDKHQIGWNQVISFLNEEMS